MGSNASKGASSATKVGGALETVAPRRFPKRNSPSTTFSAAPEPRHGRGSVNNKHAYEKSKVKTTLPRGSETDQEFQVPSISQEDSSSSHLNPQLVARLTQLGPIYPNAARGNLTHGNQIPNPTVTSSEDIQQDPVPFRPPAFAPSQTIFPASNLGQNSAVSLLTARYRLAEEAEREFANIGRHGHAGRQFLDAVTLRQILIKREQINSAHGDIEKMLDLQKGIVRRLGRKGIVSAETGAIDG